MHPSQITDESLRAMSAPDRKTLMGKLKAEKAKLQSRLSEIDDAVKRIRAREDIPGYFTVNQYIAKNSIKLTEVERSRLGALLKKGADKGEWEQGEETVKVENKGRQQRQRTYPPAVIKRLLHEVKS